MRKVRVKVPKGRYHITSRINNREMFFESDVVKVLFMAVVKRAQKKYNFVIYNFCIMGNHVHYMIKPAKGTDLSRIIQWINSVFAKHYNVTYGRTGHVWGERFHSTLLADIVQYINAFFYVADNPVKAELVLSRADYFFNGVTSILKGDFSIIKPPHRYLMEAILDEKNGQINLLKRISRM